MEAVQGYQSEPSVPVDQQDKDVIVRCQQRQEVNIQIHFHCAGYNWNMLGAHICLNLAIIIYGRVCFEICVGLVPSFSFQFQFWYYSLGS